MVNAPYMIDIYKGDEVSDAGGPLAGFEKVKASHNGIAFLYHKATQSSGYQDPRVSLRYDHWMTGETIPVTDVDGAKLMLKPRFGFYHFNGTLSDIGAEVQNFLHVIGQRHQKGDAVCFDWEGIGGSGYQVPADKVDLWCQQVEQKLGISCDVYGGNVPREQFQHRWPDALVERFSKRRFWFCNYNRAPAGIPLPWQHTGITWWQDDGDQYGPGPHTIPGIIGYCDNSTVVGAMTVARANEIWGT